MNILCDEFLQTLTRDPFLEFRDSIKTVFLFCTGHFSSDRKGERVGEEFEGDARSILSKVHHYHTQSNMAQHEVVTLTTYITNLSLTDSWKGTTRQFLCHFKEKLRLVYGTLT